MKDTVYVQDGCNVKLEMDEGMPLISISLGTEAKSRCFTGVMFKFAHSESYRRLANLLILFADASDKLKEN